MKSRGIPIKTASRCMVVFESIVTKLQLVISICSVIYSPTWLPVLINFAFLALAIFSLASYAFCWRKRNNLLVLPILIYETVTIFWTMVWLYASITAVATGYLWSLEWIGGPRSDRATVSYDMNDIRYVDPNESSPETRNAIKYGSIIIIASLVVFVLKGLAWSIARRVFRELRKENTRAMEDDNDHKINSDGTISNGLKNISTSNQSTMELNPVNMKSATLSMILKESYI
ncbi:hypothetical protein Angca_000778 [Angiostrongylus cantonensis]|nr:hypothetical protein Angca_000778 [Angiostrongylus cantonensis]